MDYGDVTSVVRYGTDIVCYKDLPLLVDGLLLADFCQLFFLKLALLLIQYYLNL
jgi:hypothetical protein